MPCLQEYREKTPTFYSAEPVASKLIAEIDDLVLSSEEIDATRIVFKLVDQEGHLIPYINESIKINISGHGELVGPDLVSLVGGCIGTWVKTKGQKGEIVVSALCSQCHTALPRH